MQIKKYVITGGPGIGKTTLIEELKRLGYATIPEVPRLLIEEKKKVDENFSPLSNPQQFQKEVIEYQDRLESKIASGPVFLDRGIIDNYGYSIFYKMPVPIFLEEHGHGRYDKIFLLDPLPFYQTDRTRYEDEETALAIHRAIEEGYRKFGYEIIKVPVFPPKDRANFVIRNII